MDHVRIDPKFRRRPRPKRAGWAAREVFKFLLEVSAEFDLHGRFSASMQDVAWLTEEWVNGDEVGRSFAREMLDQEIPKLVEVGLLHRDGGELVVTDWEEFYRPGQTNAERQAEYRERRKAEAAAKANALNAGNAVTPVTTRDNSNATTQHYTAQHNTEQQQQQPAPVAVLAPPAPPAPPPVEAAPPPQPSAGMPVKQPLGPVERPTTPPEAWEGLDFWRWTQDRRQASGYLPERPPHPRKVSAWWSEARMVVSEVKRLKAAYYAFGEDPFWRAQAPPFPFAGFMSQWERFVPPVEEDAHAT